jgi:hypothetical protein
MDNLNRAMKAPSRALMDKPNQALEVRSQAAQVALH